MDRVSTRKQLELFPPFHVRCSEDLQNDDSYLYMNRRVAHVYELIMSMGNLPATSTLLLVLYFCSIARFFVSHPWLDLIGLVFPVYGIAESLTYLMIIVVYIPRLEVLFGPFKLVVLISFIYLSSSLLVAIMNGFMVSTSFFYWWSDAMRFLPQYSLRPTLISLMLLHSHWLHLTDHLFFWIVNYTPLLTTLLNILLLMNYGGSTRELWAGFWVAVICNRGIGPSLLNWLLPPQFRGY